jgi:hypothetical protein
MAVNKSRIESHFHERFFEQSEQKNLGPIGLLDQKKKDKLKFESILQFLIAKKILKGGSTDPRFEQLLLLYQ